MNTQQYSIANGNQATAHIAYKTNEVCTIYPITPSSEMSELVEEWSADKHENIFGSVPTVFEMQSEGGVAGALHGAIQTGSLATTFTASQGLLLMMPSMYKIAGELTPNVIHVATRSIATHALSICCDHSDIMAVRNTGYAFLGAASVQEAHDFALIAQVATLESRVPFVHFFDGFETSHKITTIEGISDALITTMMDEDLIAAHRDRALNPNKPVLRGTSQGPDIFFQSREAINPFYDACPDIVQKQMDKFAALTRRKYRLFDYVGDPKAEQVIISMASSTEIIEETLKKLNAQGEKVGLIKVRLFRPFSRKHLMEALPESCKSIAVLDRTKEPGSTGEPLYLDIVQSLMSVNDTGTTIPKIVGGRYGLSSKVLSPNMVKAIVENLKREKPKNNFTIGINDDVTHLSLPYTNEIRIQDSKIGTDTDFVNSLLGRLLAGKGNDLPVSALPVDGTFATDTAKFDIRNTGGSLPEWDTDLCTQCGTCSMSCPQGAIQIKVYDDSFLKNAPESFQSAKSVETDWAMDLLNYTVQVNPEQCTSCNNCVDSCSAKALVTKNKAVKIKKEKANWQYFESIPEFNRTKIDTTKVSQQQLQEPLFKYSSGVDGCGESPYLKLLSQLFGDRLLVANATGSSSIFGGALPTTPWSKNKEGRGPAWSNSLFEDNAEFGLGYRLSLDQQESRAKTLLKNLMPELDFDLAHNILAAEQRTEAQIVEQRKRVTTLKAHLTTVAKAEAQHLFQVADSLVKQSVWIVGGDGWAYDMGYGGLDHVIASGKNVNVLVLDNEVYSNTGGQMSKATPFAASAKFAFNGKQKQKKDLGKMAMCYDDVYVAQVAMGADQEQTLMAFQEAESYDGPSLIIAYCHSLAHGIDTQNPSQYHKARVASGQWLLYRNDPRRIEEGLNPLQLDSAPPSIPIEDYLKLEKRFGRLFNSDENLFSVTVEQLQKRVDKRYWKYVEMSSSETSKTEAPISHSSY
ncbi:4Fe-4S binding protein [Zobellia uliginosa]|uniref:4Fe-4S binding protein n=1 Tax=Zobellia uliginosa TaxID=143224 RepID=UPI0026E191AE|nr:4Fe-4S binding protein [Zobellia uliginosa]MDO6518869.1 4Fe-4S binding protein [Zobellia uliginosa]